MSLSCVCYTCKNVNVVCLSTIESVFHNRKVSRDCVLYAVCLLLRETHAVNSCQLMTNFNVFRCRIANFGATYGISGYRNETRRKTC